LCLCLDDCANASYAPPSAKLAASIHVMRERDIGEDNDTASSGALPKRATTVCLVMPRRRGIRIIAKRVRVAFGKDFHHPAVKVVHRMVNDWFEAAVVFSMSFFNVIFQSDADVSILAAKAHLLRTEHFYVLHRNFCHAICAPVQFLFFG